MVYVRSIREAGLLLYVDALTKIVHWFFALDHTHYPDASLFIYGTWLHHCVCRVRERKLYCEEDSAQILCHIATDQGHEQTNACVKDDGGAVNLTENPVALRRWMMSGPEMARVLESLANTIEEMGNPFKLNYLWKMRGYPQFNFWILIALAMTYFSHIIINCAKIPL